MTGEHGLMGRHHLTRKEAVHRGLLAIGRCTRPKQSKEEL
jgi:hypothetical protein